MHDATANIVAPRGAALNKQRYYRRFDRIDRLMHGFDGVILGALSGLLLIVADHGWAKLARMLGGFQSTMIIHRVCAVVLIIVFVGHRPCRAKGVPLAD